MIMIIVINSSSIFLPNFNANAVDDIIYLSNTNTNYLIILLYYNNLIDLLYLFNLKLQLDVDDDQ